MHYFVYSSHNAKYPSFRSMSSKISLVQSGLPHTLTEVLCSATADRHGIANPIRMNQADLSEHA